MVLLVVGLFCLYFDLSLLLLLLARAGIEFYARLMAANLLALCVFDKHLLAPCTGRGIEAGKGAQLMDVGGLCMVVVLWLDNGYGIGSFLGLMRRMIYFYVVFYFHSFFFPRTVEIHLLYSGRGQWASGRGATANICCQRRP